MNQEFSPTAFECNELSCRVGILPLANSGKRKPAIYEDAKLFLGRDAEKQIVLSMNLGKKAKFQDVSYYLKNVKIHHNFARKEGKGSIIIHGKNLQILLSNAPPAKLNVFLKTLEAKLTLLKEKICATPTLKGGEGLITDLPIIETKLSPLSFGEIRKLRPGLKDVSNQKSSAQTPKRKAAGTPKTSQKRIKRSTPPAPVHNSIVSVRLSMEQRSVVESVLGGRCVFFSGSAGTGKSLVLCRLLGSLPPETTAVTAATGVAACHLGGVTLHSWAGMGLGTASVDQCLELASRAPFASSWRRCTHLIIDEISMVNADYFTKLEWVARRIRNNERPFGGIQVILCGDFLQLPPVTDKTQSRAFCFQTKAWKEVVQSNILLEEVRRQNDPEFIRILQEIRLGECSEEALDTLKATANNCVDRDGLVATQLCTHKADAQAINQACLNELAGADQVFEAVDTEAIPRSLDGVLCPRSLVLKTGAQVMLTKNLDLSRKLSNGSRGLVVSFSAHGLPQVRFASGLIETVTRSQFQMRTGASVLSRHQIPLQLAWAISIHKSQGLSLDYVSMDLGGVFEDGQAYVALSRARSLAGLRLLSFSRGCVRANPKVLQFYRRLQTEQSSQMRPKKLSLRF